MSSNPRPCTNFGERGSNLLRFCLASAFALLGTVAARAESCPTAKDEIATDRPDVTNSSLVVPVGSLQNENGINVGCHR